jgi:hypothetical protein
MRKYVFRHCEERSGEAIHSFFVPYYGLLRFARNDDTHKVSQGLFEIDVGMPHPHSSCPDLIRASIDLREMLFRRRWIAGSGPAMTRGAATEPRAKLGASGYPGRAQNARVVGIMRNNWEG